MNKKYLVKMSMHIFVLIVLLIGIGYVVEQYPVTTRIEVTGNEIKEPEDAVAKSGIQNSTPISLLFVGDIMLDRTIRTDGQMYGYDELFSCLKPLLAGHDAVIGNLEGTITSFPSVSQYAEYLSPESYRFTFEKEGVQALMDLGLTHVSLANNHMRDFGEEGIAQTVAIAEEMGLHTFGDPRTGKQRFYIETFGDTRIALIPYSEFFGANREQALADLEAVQNTSDMQIIFAHWGDEYAPARADVKSLAREFARAGADLIIGAHPHVIQESEIFEGTPIYYSLGNFIFDQYWEESVRNGLAVTITIQNGKIVSSTEKAVSAKRHAGTCVV